MSNLDHIYRAYQQRAALISGEDPSGAAIPGHPVSVASVGDPADAEAAGDGTLIAITKRLRTLLGNVITLLAGGLPASLGQKVKAASLPVVLPSDQGDLPVTLDGEAVVLGPPADGTYIGDINFGESLPAGDAAIGKLAANDDGVYIGDIKFGESLPAGTEAMGKVDIEATGTILRAAISAAGAGDNTIVAAGAGGIQTKVLGLLLVVSDDVDIRFENGAGGAALTGVMSLAADGNGFVLPMAMPGYHWWETSAATVLNLELSAAVQVSGCIIYYQE